MARFNARSAALALLLAACGGDGGQQPQIDAPSVFCNTSTECGPGSWCNPLGNLCEPRGTTFDFERDIYPEIQQVCEGCHVAGVPDPQNPGQNISVLAGGPDVAYASLVEGGTNCSAAPHRLCVDEPKASLAVMRLLPHLRANQTLLLPDGYADPWMQKLLHWIAAGAHRSAMEPDAGIVDAPLPVIDAPPGTPDAPIVPDAPHRIDAPPMIDARPLTPDALRPPGKPVITSPMGGASTGPHVIPVVWTAPADNGSPITQYVITAQPPTGAATTVTCTAPSFSPCVISGPSLSVDVGSLSNCVPYDITVTATNGGGSTTSDPVLDVTPRQAPSVPTLAAPPVTKGAGVGQLVFDWNASNANGCGIVSYTVELDPPAGVSCGNGSGVPCLITPTTATSFNMSTADGACPYPAVDCRNPRVWSFRVRAANLGGTSGFSSGASGTPRIGYTQDMMPNIWSTFGCAGCHNGNVNNELDLRPPALAQWNELRDTQFVVVIVGSPLMSRLHLCPTEPPLPATPVCVTFHNGAGHPGGQLYLPDSKEDTLVQRWITDGALF